MHYLDDYLPTHPHNIIWQKSYNWSVRLRNTGVGRCAHYPPQGPSKLNRIFVDEEKLWDFLFGNNSYIVFTVSHNYLCKWWRRWWRCDEVRSARTSVQQEIEIKQEQTEDIFVFLFSTLSIFNFRIMSFDAVQELLSFAFVTCFTIPSLYTFLLSILPHTRNRFFHQNNYPTSTHVQRAPHWRTCVWILVSKSTSLPVYCRRVVVVNGLSVVILTTNLTQVVLSQVPPIINSQASNITHFRRCVNVWGSCGSEVYTCVSKSVLSSVNISPNR